VTLQDLDIGTPTDFPNQIAQFHADVAPEHRLAILRDEHEDREVPSPEGEGLASTKVD
jgi:hypothetical protein